MKVSILIVTYQSEDEILDCIKSIYQNVNKIIFEIIIIDNASTDKTIKIIKDNFPEITIIENEQNKGFSFANNLGAKSAKGEFLFFLNPDSLIVENTIEKLVSIYNMDEKIGIIGPEIKNINGSIQPPALKIPSMLKHFSKHLDFIYFCQKQFWDIEVVPILIWIWMWVG